jgi:hypothetical protein
MDIGDNGFMGNCADNKYNPTSSVVLSFKLFTYNNLMRLENRRIYFSVLHPLIRK